MRKSLFSALILLICLITLSNSQAFAYVIDGDLGDWGVVPFSDWIPNSSTVDYSEYDNLRGDGLVTPDPPWGIGPWGGELYDVEALYFDDDSNYLYLGMVSSYPLSGGVAGDLGLNFGPDDYYEYGLKIRGLNPSGSLISTGLWYNPSWELINYTTLANPVYMNSGTNLGNIELSYRNLGGIEGPGMGDTYILEARLSRSLFNLPLSPGYSLSLHWGESCANDYIDVEGDIDHSTPEPTSILLFLSGLLGLGAFKFRKEKRK